MKNDNTISRRNLLKTACGAAIIAPFLQNAGYAAVVVEKPMLEICGPWQVQVNRGTAMVGKRKVRVKKAATLEVPAATSVTVHGEQHANLPLYDANAAPWTRGAKPNLLNTYECTATGMLVNETFVVRSQASDGTVYEKGKDYDVEPLWSTFGRIAGGAIPEGATVYVDYTCGLYRIDSVSVDAKGEVTLLKGEPHNATPHPPLAPEGSTIIANIWVPGRIDKLVPDNLYPIVEPIYPDDLKPISANPPASKLLPKSWAKIASGEPLHILAWGDSVTAGGQASDARHQYQQVFVDLLKARYPKSQPLLTTAGWGGRNTDSFLNEPPGTQYNFDHAVIEPRPDLIVMEFVNDAYMTPEVLEQKYSYLLKRFQEIGAEWIILTPHFVRPDWMGEKSVRVEVDPRPYTAGVRQFCAKHQIALADASLRWGHLLKEGIPYTTLLSNSINHPDDRGHEMFAKAILELF